jgi:hypothetical protein
MTTKQEIEEMAKELAEGLTGTVGINLEEMLKDPEMQQQLETLYEECVQFLTELDEVVPK